MYSWVNGLFRVVFVLLKPVFFFNFLTSSVCSLQITAFLGSPFYHLSHFFLSFLRNLEQEERKLRGNGVTVFHSDAVQETELKHKWTYTVLVSSSLQKQSL